jgi:hypothetical protein
MFARMTTFEGAPEQVDEMTRYADEQVLPALRGVEGYEVTFAEVRGTQL